MNRLISVGLAIAVAPAILLPIAQLYGSEDLVKVSEVALFDAAIPLGAALVFAGLLVRLSSVTAKRYPFLAQLPARELSTLRDRLRRPPREWCTPFLLGIAVPFLAPVWLVRLFDFGTLWYGGPLAAGFVFSVVAVCAAIKNRLPAPLVALLLLAGIPFGSSF